MKKIAALCLTYAITIQTAMANHPTTIDCAPYAADAQAARATVNNFNQNVEQLRQRLQAAESQVYERRSQLNGQSHLLSNLEARLVQINSEIAQTRNQRINMNELLQQRAVLENSIARTQAELRDLAQAESRSTRGNTVVRARRGTPPGPVVRDHRTPRGPVVRDHRTPPGPVVRDHRTPRPSESREVLLRQLAGLNAQLTQVNARIVQTEQSLARLGQLQNEIRTTQDSIHQTRQTLAQLQNARPSMEALQDAVARVSERLNGHDQVQAGNLAVLVHMEEKLLMCKTYTVKYPKALQEAAEISRQGCHSYQMPRVQGPFKVDAVKEIYQAICNR